MLAAIMIIFMSLFRVNLYFLSVFHATPDAVFVEVGQSFLAGLRFDILIFGFLMIPIYFLLMIGAFTEKWPAGVLTGYKVYLGIAWLVICLLTFVDFFHFAKFGTRMRFADYTSWNFSVLLEQMQAMQRHQILIFSVITLMLLSLGYMLTMSLKFGEWKDEFSPIPGSKWEITWRVLFPLLIVFLAARGTVDAHHLGLEHSEVSSMKAINEMALNPVWCFDK
jgi:hypothetical protein